MAKRSDEKKQQPPRKPPVDVEEHYRSTVRLKLRWRQLAKRSGVGLAELHRVSDARFLFQEHPMTPEEEAELERLTAEWQREIAQQKEERARKKEEKKQG